MGEKKLIQEAKLGLRAAGAHVAVAYRMRSQQIGEGGQRHNGSGVANLLEVARGTSSTSTTSRRGRAATTALSGGGAGAAAGAGRVGRASRKLRDVELAALVIDRDGAVALASGIAGVECVALTECLLADESRHSVVVVLQAGSAAIVACAGVCQGVSSAVVDRGGATAEGATARVLGIAPSRPSSGLDLVDINGEVLSDNRADRGERDESELGKHFG